MATVTKGPWQTWRRYAGRGRTGWREVTDPPFLSRWYDNGAPTGLVTVAAWDERFDDPRTTMVLDGHAVRLIWRAGRITVIERSATGRRGAKFDVPLGACVGARLDDEPGVPGSAAIALALAVRLGPRSSAELEIRLRFAAAARPHLDPLVHEIHRRVGLGAEPKHDKKSDRHRGDTARGPLPRLPVESAPNTDEWVVFRPMRSSTDAVLPSSSDIHGRRARPEDR
ncbi:hypothetical protein [Actinokineospora sp.]|uniref:hypothetical protein n=1 Tax=Actinokineospora sp. TaxID=1872133 RepID=UPI004037A476